MLNRQIRYIIRRHCRRFLHQASVAVAAAQTATTVKIMRLIRCQSLSIPRERTIEW